MFARIRNSELWKREGPLKTAWAVIGWWEARRIAYNLIVGCAGIISCGICLSIAICASVFFNSDFGVPDGPLLAILTVVLYAFVANVCYTGGWIAELLVRSIWPAESDRFARYTFKIGVWFSVLLTLTPAALMIALGSFELLKRLARSHG